MTGDGWTRDDGYSGCKTRRFGDIAVVICPPENDGLWGYQAFDESCDGAIAYGETYAEDYGFATEQSVINYVESILE